MTESSIANLTEEKFDNLLNILTESEEAEGARSPRNREAWWCECGFVYVVQVGDVVEFDTCLKCATEEHSVPLKLKLLTQVQAEVLTLSKREISMARAERRAKNSAVTIAALANAVAGQSFQMQAVRREWKFPERKKRRVKTEAEKAEKRDRRAKRKAKKRKRR